MLLAGRCDYFPRSVAEGYGEVESVAPDQLMAYGRVIIAYRFPMYFFVGKDNAALAVRVEKGLLAALDDGSFLALLKKHPVTSKVFRSANTKRPRSFGSRMPICRSRRLWRRSGIGWRSVCGRSQLISRADCRERARVRLPTGLDAGTSRRALLSAAAYGPCAPRRRCRSWWGSTFLRRYRACRLRASAC